jgi:hypothetical protein
VPASRASFVWGYYSRKRSMRHEERGKSIHFIVITSSPTLMIPRRI